MSTCGCLMETHCTRQMNNISEFTPKEKLVLSEKKNYLKLFYSLFIIIAIFSCIRCSGQTKSREYKTFNDTLLKVGDKLLTPEIFFTLSGGSRVIPEHEDSVKVIADFLAMNKDIHIEIGVHTDNRGKAEANLKLSEFRGKSVKYLLIGKFNVLSDRIIAKGYGESNPLIAVDEIQKEKLKEKKEELYSRNRRIEIKIIKN